MRSHKRYAVLALLIAIAAFLLPAPASAQKHAPHTASMKGTAAAAATTTGTAATPPPGPPALSLAPAALSFDAEVGRAAPTAQSLAISSNGPAVSYSVSSSSTGNWLRVKAGSAKTPGSVSISADSAGLSPGTYSGTVVVASSDVANSPIPVAVTLTVAPPPITLAPTALSFTAQEGGVAPPDQSIVTGSGNGAPIGFTLAASSSEGWLTVKPATGTTGKPISIAANPAGLAAGTYSGTVVVDCSGASNCPVPVPVTFTVNPVPTIAVGPELLTFVAKAGDRPPAPQMITTRSSAAPVPYAVTASSTGGWLGVSSSTGITPEPVSVTVNPVGLAAGPHTGTVTITSKDGSAPQVVAIAFNVSPADLPTLGVAPAYLAFVGQAGGTSPPSQTVLTTSSKSAINYTVSAVSKGNWLSASVNTGSTPGSLKITANPSGLAAGTYTGTVILASPDAANSSQAIEASFTVTAATLPAMSVGPPTLSFTSHTGEVTQASQTITISSGGAPFHYTASTASASWLKATPVSGASPGAMNISVAPAGLAAGTYTGAVTVSAEGVANSPQAVFVTLTVSPKPVPRLAVSPASMTFTAQAGGKPPAGQTIAMVSTGDKLGFKVSTGTSASWLSATPNDGATPGSITVSVNPAGLAAGTYNSSVSIAASDAGNSPRVVPVTLVVTAAGKKP
ncbi:hypothetical protein DYQ86_19075 [Acidobacteria bacterium AB60]|nr:hypothetical protein DYQ86_19075 [Acidobacteria bacterium AB60]